MKRSLWVALSAVGVGWAAHAQEAVEFPPADAASPAESGLDAGDGAAAPPAEGVQPLIDDPVGDDAVRPGDALEGAQPTEPGLPGSPIDSDPAVPGRNLRDPETLPDTILDTPVLPENDRPAGSVPRTNPSALPGDAAGDADGLGAPLIEEGRVPSTSPADDLPPANVDPRLPIERQPLPADPALSEPLVTDPDSLPLPRRRPVIDPAYGAPAPPRPRPEIAIDDVVRNPIRIYETRLLVLMGHATAAEEAIDILARRFPTDARVPYLRFFHLSRTGQRDAAMDALRQAVAMERLYPVTDYNRFMEPLQGPDRYYAERVRRATAELAAADGLVEPDPDEVISDVPPPAPRPRRDGPAPGPAQIDSDAARPTPPRDALDRHLPDGPQEGIDPAPGLETAPRPIDEEVPNT